MGVDAGVYPSTPVLLVGEVLHQERMDVEDVHVVRMREVGCGPDPRVFLSGEALFRGRVEVHVEEPHRTLAYAGPAVYGSETLDG